MKHFLPAGIADDARVAPGIAPGRGLKRWQPVESATKLQVAPGIAPGRGLKLHSVIAWTA